MATSDWVEFSFPGVSHLNETVTPREQIQSSIVRHLMDGTSSMTASTIPRPNDFIKPGIYLDNKIELIDAISIFCTVCNAFKPGHFPTQDDMWEICNLPGKRNDEIYLTQSVEWTNETMIRIPLPYASRDLEKRFMVCSLTAHLNTTFNSPREDKAVSKIFWALNEPRLNPCETESSCAQYIYKYDNTHPEGEYYTEQYYAPVRYTACSGGEKNGPCPSDDEWSSLPLGARIGIIIGAVFGFAILATCIYCLHTRRIKKQPYPTALAEREARRPMPLSVYLAQREQQQREGVEREERRAREARLVALSANAGSLGTVREVEERRRAAAADSAEKPPPSYRETVSDGEAFLAQHAIRRNQRLGQTPPYSPTVAVPSSPALDFNEGNIEELPGYPPPAAGRSSNTRPLPNR